MYEKLDELKIRIKNLLERENELKKGISNIDIVTMSRNDAKRLEQLRKDLANIISSKQNIIEPKCKLLDMYVEAKMDIEKINTEGINKSVRTKLIDKLAELLIEISKIDNVLGYTDDDVRKLQIERNNPEVFNEFITMFDNYVDGSIKTLINEINAELDNLEKANHELDKISTKKIGKIVGSVALAAGILIGVQSCSKNKDGKVVATKVRVDNYTETPENTNNDTLKIIDNNGEEIAVETPVPTSTLDIIGTPVETFNPSADKEADLARRSTRIAETGFFEDVYNSDIIDILNSIESGDILTDNGFNYRSLFRANLTTIVEHYMFNNITEKDLKSLNALRYIAKDNSDLDRFLETYTDLLTEILKNPTNQDAKDKMNSYIKVFSNHFTGFVHPEDTNPTLTDDKEFNEHAIVEGELNWHFVNTVILDSNDILLIPANILNTDGFVLETIMYSITNSGEINTELINSYLDNAGFDANTKKYVFDEIKTLLDKYPEDVQKMLDVLETKYTRLSIVQNPLLNDCYIVGSEYDAPAKLTLGGEN